MYRPDVEEFQWRPLAVFFSILLLIISNSAKAENIGHKREAILLITKTADSICNTVSTHGNTSSIEATGDVKAQLSNLVKILGDAGFAGAAKINSDQYDSVLRQDLAAALRDNAACKLRVLEDLKDAIIDSPTNVQPAVSPNIAQMVTDKLDEWVGSTACQDGRYFSVKFQPQVIRGRSVTGLWSFQGAGSGSSNATLSPDPRADDERSYVLVPSGNNVFKYDLVAIGDKVLKGHSVGQDNCRIILER